MDSSFIIIVAVVFKFYYNSGSSIQVYHNSGSSIQVYHNSGSSIQVLS